MPDFKVGDIVTRDNPYDDTRYEVTAVGHEVMVLRAILNGGYGSEWATSATSRWEIAPKVWEAGKKYQRHSDVWTVTAVDERGFALALMIDGSESVESWFAFAPGTRSLYDEVND